MTEAELLAIKARAAKALLAIPHVNAVGIGGRERNGQPTGELVIKVFVTRKKPPGDVPADELIPASIEGVATDVVEMSPTVRLASAEPGVTMAVAKSSQMDSGNVTPLQGGMMLTMDPHINQGTLGCILRDLNDGTAVYGLTNYHVAADDNGKLLPSWKGMQKQPDPADTYAPFATVEGGGKDRTRDAALIRIAPKLTWLPKVEQIGFIKGSHDLTSDEVTPLTYQVRKRGAKTRLTGGVVVAIQTTFRRGLEVDQQDQIVIRPNFDEPQSGQQMAFAYYGDSGSVIVNGDNEVVGLLWGIELETDASNLQPLSYAFSIKSVLDRFKAVEGLDLEVAKAGPWLDATDETETKTVDPVAGATLLPTQQQIARADAHYYRPLLAGSQILAAPMAATPNAGTLGCVVTDAANPNIAYALTAYGNLTANGTLTPTADMDIGQPDNHSSISGCCSNTVAHFTTGGPDKGLPTAAIVRLKDDQKWLPEILRIGRISSALNVLEQGLSVLKHGAETRLTGGTVIAVGGRFGTIPPGVRDDAIIIRPNLDPSRPDAELCFSQFADRGAAVVDDSGIVQGLLYDEIDLPDTPGRRLIHGVATPMTVILDALEHGAGIKVTVGVESSLGHVQTTSSREALHEGPPLSRPLVRPPMALPPVRVPVGEADWVRGAPDALADSAAGQWMTAAWRAHQAELRHLVASNRKVAAIWHRSGGPALLQAIARTLRLASARIPGLVNGVPIALCIDRLAKIFARYGSRRLGEDLALLRSRLPPIEGLAGHELLATLGDTFAGLGLPDLPEAAG